MTKVLYIPTGEFIRWNSIIYSNYGDYHESTLELIKEYLGSPEKEVEELLKIKYSDNLKQWLTSNNIILPILREELEIIYD